MIKIGDTYNRNGDTAKVLEINGEWITLEIHWKSDWNLNPLISVYPKNKIEDQGKWVKDE